MKEQIQYESLRTTNVEKVIDQFYQQIKNFSMKNRLYIAQELLDAVTQRSLVKIK